MGLARLTIRETCPWVFDHTGERRRVRLLRKDCRSSPPSSAGNSDLVNLGFRYYKTANVYLPESKSIVAFRSTVMGLVSMT